MSKINFNSEVEREHRRIDEKHWKKIYVVGDVHGCLLELEELLDKINPESQDLLVFVGDLIRKGPESNRVVNLVRKSPNMMSVRGNNEEKVINGEKDPSLSRKNLEYIESLPVVISWEDTVVVHGGVNPHRRIEDHGIEDIQEMRSIDGAGYDGTFWFEEYDFQTRVFFGHTVLDEPLKIGNAIGLDTGCVYGGKLTAYDCKNRDFIEVPSKSTYRNRDERYIVSTEVF